MESLTTGPELENSQGHFQPRQQALLRDPLPLDSEKQTSGPYEKMVAKCQQRSGAGAARMRRGRHATNTQ
jgi:hypothetical protein